MAEERAIYSLLSSHSEIVSMRCRSPFLWFFYVLFVGLIQRCTVVFLTGCVLRRSQVVMAPSKNLRQNSAFGETGFTGSFYFNLSDKKRRFLIEMNKFRLIFVYFRIFGSNIIKFHLKFHLK